MQKNTYLKKLKDIKTKKFHFLKIKTKNMIIKKIFIQKMRIKILQYFLILIILTKISLKKMMNQMIIKFKYLKILWYH